ncbi:MAG: hypothetical protein ACT4O0_18955 [Pseudonocardia sp.]
MCGGRWTTLVHRPGRKVPGPDTEGDAVMSDHDEDYEDDYEDDEDWDEDDEDWDE